MNVKKNLGLIAHDFKKKELLEWVEYNWEILSHHKLICTGTSGKLVEEALLNKMLSSKKEIKKLNITKLKSGPLGGDQQMGSLISNGGIDILIFFWDPMSTQPHDVDVKALLRLCMLYNIPTCCNKSTADFVISSSLFASNYTQTITDYSDYLNRKI